MNAQHRVNNHKIKVAHYFNSRTMLDVFLHWLSLFTRQNVILVKDFESAASYKGKMPRTTKGKEKIVQDKKKTPRPKRNAKTTKNLKSVEMNLSDSFEASFQAKCTNGKHRNINRNKSTMPSKCVNGIVI